MAEILSQSQIDDLLNELACNESDKNKKDDTSNHNYKIYDFKSPKKLSREYIKILTSMMEVFSRHIAAYFAGVLRSYCEVSVESIEEHPYYEYNNALPDSMVSGIIELGNPGGVFVMDLSNSLTFLLVDRMLGGNIEDLIVPNRDFTDIEVTICERVFKRLCVLLQETFQSIPGTAVSLRQIETNTRFIKAIRIEEIVEVIVLKVSIGNMTGTITLCIPYTNIESLIKSLAKMNEIQKKNVSEPRGASELHEMNSIVNSTVDVRATLGSVKLSLHDIANLQEGDVIKLDQPIDSLVKVSVNGKDWFWGQPGVKKRNKAVMILKYFKE